MRPRNEREPLPGFLSAEGAIVAGIAVLAVVATLAAVGAGMFSPGELNARTTGRTLGGVASHAATGGDCEACHTAPWSAATMGARCLRCHTDVEQQLTSGKGLHARMAGTPSAPSCLGCHTEHRGATASLTFFDHAAVGFPLTGGHKTVACDKCHPNAATMNDFRNAPRECVGCHAKDDPHKGAFGRKCEDCHNPSAWDDVNFDHSIFPTDHGAEERRPTCKTCHPVDVSRYTCYGCHRHTPANVVAEHEGRSLTELTDCIKCHKGGRKEGGD